MNELLTAFLILLISVSMFALIMLIIKANKKVIALNNNIESFKQIDLTKFQKAIRFLNKMNTHVRFSKIKHYFEIGLTAISTINLIILFKKISNKYKKKRAK